jgi:predicted permease
MRWSYKLPLRFRSLFRRSRVEQELTDELRFHLQKLIEDNTAKGMKPEQARNAARRELGGVEQIKEECRDMRRVNFIENLIQDVRYGLRMLAKSPGFTSVVILSLALGIGANTSIFTLINDLLLKNLPVRDPQQLVSFGTAEGGGTLDGLGVGPLDLFSYEFYQQMREQKAVFLDVCAFGSQREALQVRVGGSASGIADQAVGRLVSGNYFTVLGVDAALGRMIEPSDDDATRRHAVAVISDRYWQQKFSGNPDVLGESIVVNNTPFTIIGVAPPKFYGETIGPQPPDIWMPLTMQPQVTLTPSLLGPHGMYWLHLIGRQRSEVSAKQAQEWVNLRFRQHLIDRQGSQITQDDRDLIRQMYVQLVPGGRGVSSLRSEYSQPLKILMGVVVLVLLIASANLANLLLARTAAREREISTRLALGAGRFRIVRQVLTETLLLSGLGGAVGLLFAYAGTGALINFVTAAAGSRYIPIEARADAPVLAFTTVVSLATGILFGLVPALRVSRVGLAPSMKAGVGRVTGDPVRAGRLPLPKILVAAQTALSLLLLVGAGLFVRTLRNLENQDFGFNRRNVLMVTLGLKTAGYKPDQLGPLYERLLDTMSALPGVHSATLAMLPPMSGMTWGGPVTIPGHVAQPNEDMDTAINSVAPHYFETVGIPLLRGRVIGLEDTAASPKVAVVNQTFARYFFPHGDAVGRSFGVPGEERIQREIVGIVHDSKYHDPREAPGRMIYLPISQLSGDDLYAGCLQLRTTGDPARVSEEVRRALVQINSNLPILRVITLTQQVDNYLNHEELISQLSGFFALLALLLACVGLYGVMNYNVVRRTNEIGIRMALGAQFGGVLWLVLKESVLLLGIGVAAGIPIALAATRLVRTQLFGLSQADPLSLVAATLCLALASLLAGYLPARRATKVDPMVALRYE